MTTALEIVQALRGRLADTLIALDFDGTLAPIVTDPGQARPVPGTVAALRAAAAHGAQVAVITGRDARTLLELSGLAEIRGLVVEGIYGAERWANGQLHTTDTPPSITALRRDLPTVLAEQGADPAVWIEDKRLSLVVHARRATDPPAALAPLREPVGELARRLGFEVHPGRGLIELRLPGEDKGTALRRLVEGTGMGAVLFAGDDVGDLPAFTVVAELRAQGRAAFSVGVGSAEVPEVGQVADVSVGSPADLVDLLKSLTSAG